MTIKDKLIKSTITELKRQIVATKKMLSETKAPGVRRGLEAFLRSNKRAVKFWEEMK